ncbi:MAG TPA: isochorismatase family cysteine hydrolase, partial [Gaiellaceae bacterium]|nr:isochorismatase family cysteine hydrolase [Gaiellaceae bacterium]
MRDALVVIDLLQRFDHEDGDALLASLRGRLPGLVDALDRARADGTPVVYVNDLDGRWDSNAPALVRDALDGPGGDVLAEVAPREGDRVLLKPRYSIFDHTPLVVLLRELEVERLLLTGAATEMCVVQSAIDARELGFKVSILAGACATTDPELERLAFEYAERVVGA